MEKELFYFGAILITASILALIAIRFKQSFFVGLEFSILIASLFITNSLASQGIREIIAIYVFVLMILSTVLIKRYTKTCRIEV